MIAPESIATGEQNHAASCQGIPCARESGILKSGYKIVKSHPGYSGGTLTSTYEIARDIGWDFFERLAKQNVMQVQSVADPPKKIALGERSIMMDGGENLANLLKDQGAPVEIIYPAEGTPM